MYTLCNTFILTFFVQVEENLKKKKKKDSDGQCTEQWILLMPQESVSPESCVSWWVQKLVPAGKHPSPLLSQGTSVGTARRPDGRTFTQTSPASAAWTPATRRYVPQLLQLYAAALLPPLCSAIIRLYPLTSKEEQLSFILKGLVWWAGGPKLFGLVVQLLLPRFIFTAAVPTRSWQSSSQSAFVLVKLTVCSSRCSALFSSSPPILFFLGCLHDARGFTLKRRFYHKQMENSVPTWMYIEFILWIK